MESDPIREINGLNWETLDLNIQKFLIIYVASGVLSDYDFNIRMDGIFSCGGVYPVLADTALVSIITSYKYLMACVPSKDWSVCACA